MAIAMQHPEREPPCGNYGDVNGDGLVTIEDGDLISYYLGGRRDLSAEQKRRADVSGTGGVDDDDLTLISLYIDGRIDTFPVCMEEPECESGETECRGSDLWSCFHGMWILTYEDYPGCKVTVGTINESRSSFPSSGTTGQPVDIDIYWGNSGSEAGTCYLRIYEYPGTLNENLLFSKDKQFAAGGGTSTVASPTVPDVDTWPLGVKVWGDDESEPSWGSSATGQWQLSTSPLEKPPLWQMAAIPIGLIAVGALIEYR